SCRDGVVSSRCAPLHSQQSVAIITSALGVRRLVSSPYTRTRHIAVARLSRGCCNARSCARACLPCPQRHPDREESIRRSPRRSPSALACDRSSVSVDHHVALSVGDDLGGESTRRPRRDLAAMGASICDGFAPLPGC